MASTRDGFESECTKGVLYELSSVIRVEFHWCIECLQLVVHRIRGSGLEGSSLLLIFAGERKGSSHWPGARAFKSADRRKHQLDFPRISSKNVNYFKLN
jgi:hypothetical protein